MQMVSSAIQKQMEGASWIRRMFEKGLELKKQFGADNVFDFSLGNPDIPPPPSVCDMLTALAAQARQPMAFGYCPNAGLPAFREAIAAMLTHQQQVPVAASGVVITCGAAGAPTSFFRAVLDPGDEVITPAPCFVEYGAYCGHFGGTLKTTPCILPTFQPDLDALEAAITDKTRAIIINSPNNPTGCVYPQETLTRLGQIVDRVNATRQRPLFIVSDEPYRFLAYDGASVPPVLPASPFALVVGSFSKSLSLAGERIGYIATTSAMPDVTLLMNAVTMTNRSLGFVNAPVIGQRLAMGLLEEGVDLSIYARRREAMAKVLTDAGITFTLPQGAFYFFPQAPGGDDLAFTDVLLKHNVLAVPGRGFGLPGYFRLSFSVEDHVITNSAAAFAAAVAEMRL